MRHFLAFLLLTGSGLAHGAALPPADALDNVTSVVVEGALQLDIEAGSPAELWVRKTVCESALVWELRSGRLKLSLDPANAGCPAEQVQVGLRLRLLEELAVHGRAEASVRGLAAPRFRLETDSSGDVELEDINCDQLEVVSNGSGDIMAGGRAARQRFQLGGDGDVDARELTGIDVAVSSSGDGDVQVNATASLTITSSGSGDILYVGHPRVQQRLTGSGSVHHSD
jgi:Putative auto-transporter adhesin, head GIN domain